MNRKAKVAAAADPGIRKASSPALGARFSRRGYTLDPSTLAQCLLGLRAGATPRQQHAPQRPHRRDRSLFGRQGCLRSLLRRPAHAAGSSPCTHSPHRLRLLHLRHAPLHERGLRRGRRAGRGAAPARSSRSKGRASCASAAPLAPRPAAPTSPVSASLHAMRTCAAVRRASAAPWRSKSRTQAST